MTSAVRQAANVRAGTKGLIPTWRKKPSADTPTFSRVGLIMQRGIWSVLAGMTRIAGLRPARFLKELYPCARMGGR